MFKPRKGKLILGILIGVIGAAAIFCLAVGIGCAVNGVTFGQQIVNWFGATKEVAEEVAETTAKIAL
jgi:hypothetical protein